MRWRPVRPPPGVSRRVLWSALILSVLLLGAARPQWFACLFATWCYESPPSHFTVVDAESGQPLADVHVLATWEQYGRGSPVPLVAVDGLTGLDGSVALPGWGPFLGSSIGLQEAESPVITLFKPGYRTLLLWNDTFPDNTDMRTRKRSAAYKGRTVALEPFHGSHLAWYGQLRKAGAPVTGHPATQIVQAHNPYVNRLRRMLPEVERLPRYRVSERTVSIDGYFEGIKDHIKRIESRQW